MSKAKRVLMSIAIMFLVYSLGIYLLFTYLFGALAFNLLNSPVFMFLLFFNASLVYIYVLLILYVFTQYRSFKIRGLDRKGKFRISLLVPGLTGALVSSFILSINPVLYPLRESGSVFSFGPLILLWISVVAIAIGSFTFWAVIERWKPKIVSQEKVARLHKSLVIGTTCAILLSTSFATYIAVPFLQNQHIIPHGGGVYFESSGGYTTYFMTALRNGELNGSISSTANFTFYLLNSTQFSYLVSISQPGSPPLPANYTLLNYCYSSGTVKSVNFEMHITRGNYYVILFNRGGIGTLISADWLIYTPNATAL